jgi:flagellar FliL protein
MPKEDAEAAEAPAAAPKAPNPWLPVIAVLVLMPVISFAMTQYILIPHIQSSVGASQAQGGEGEGASASISTKASATASAKGGDKKDVKPSFSYQFDDIVVNLSGAMGTRYLKASFSIFSSNPDLQKIMTENKPHLLDVALNVLSSKSMADLEAPGSKNLVRNDLITNFNQALSSEIVEQIYFSEFVVQ